MARPQFSGCATESGDAAEAPRPAPFVLPFHPRAGTLPLSRHSNAFPSKGFFVSQSAPVDPAAASPGGVMGFFHSFFDLFRLPRAFWIVIAIFVIESTAYFAALTLMNEFLSHDLGWGDARAGLAVSFFTGSVTLFMLGAGSYAESFGLRRALIAAMLLCIAGRCLYALIPQLRFGSSAAPPSMATLGMLASLVVIALGEAILQPVCYSGIKQYTDEKTSSMGYGLIYALMNGGIVAGAALSSYLRPRVQKVLDFQQGAAEQVAIKVDDAAAQNALNDPVAQTFAKFSPTGIQAVNWLCVAIAVAALLTCFLLTRRVVAAKLRPDRAEEMRKTAKGSRLDRLGAYFLEGPFSNARFIFFIFMLLPVRTLFAHQFQTLPQYVLRAYSARVGDWMEWIANAINPAIILIGVPICTALTRKVHVYKMMIIGSLVSAAPTFLLCGGPNLTFLIVYQVLFSIGEALWSARFLEYASELAPEGRIAQYMGLANVPWLIAKFTTGLYSGTMLEVFCPRDTPIDQLHTGTLWFIYGCIAMASPIGLLVARRWVMSGSMHKTAAA